MNALTYNFRPDRVTIMPHKKIGFNERMERLEKKLLPKKKNENSLKNLQVKKHSFNLSKSSKRNLRDSINTLICLSPAREITSKNKKLYNYRGSFITLTLPSEQKNTDLEIKECLNLFLTDLRRVYDLKNYVWKAEIQRNGNIHFHIVIDIYIHVNVIRNYWLKSLRNTNQVAEYQKKFSNMSLMEYYNYRKNQSVKNDKEVIPVFQNVKEAYIKGVRSKWLVPNCVDVRPIFSISAISFYLSKYLTKNSDEKDGERAKNFGRVWGRSQSLSKIKYRFPLTLKNDTIIKALKTAKKSLFKVYDYCSIIYYSLDNLPKWISKYIYRYIYDIGKTFNYPFVSLE